ncbi:MAG: ComF family protein [Candidatus Omnitrophica bacterium]|nr:ComF family protein [Candidatus Omnitrophota bacterium]MCF7893923.1 ComF family protein [Candidatus Omnitrophota bacterium]
MLKKWLVTTKNLFFPAVCLACGKKIKQDYLCSSCKKKIKILKAPTCYTQLKINHNNNKEILTVLSSCLYKEPLKNLIHSFKYKRNPYLAEFFSRFMLKQLKVIKFNPQNYDFVVPVPLHRYKIKARGYNQAELLARPLAKYFQLPLKDDIIISKYIKNSQTKLSSRKRKENVQGKFIVRKNLKNQNIILVDDVLTTGATISTCWQALSEKGANKIYSTTLAK